MLKKSFLAGLLAVILPLSAALAEEAPPLSPAQQEMVRKLVRDTIIANPTIVTEALEALRAKEQQSADDHTARLIADHAGEIFDNDATPVLGNLKGDVAIVEFFDYRCPYCKAMAEALFSLAKADGGVRLIMKDIPVLGPESVFAARAALAARNQGKYGEAHKALMLAKGPLTEQAVLKIAADLGLNVEKLRKDMDDPQIEKALQANLHLVHELGVTGTPAFVIGNRIVPGAMPEDALKQLVDQARKSRS